MTSIDTGSDIGDAYLEQAKGTTLTKRTAQHYAGSLRQFITFLSTRDTCLLEADLKHVMGFFRHRVERMDRQGTLSYKRSAIKGVYRFAVLETDYEPNVRLSGINAIDISNFNTPPKIEREPLSRDELSLLIDATNSRRDELLIFTTLAAGIRNSETRHLKIEDFNPKEQALWIAAPKGVESYENCQPYSQPISPLLTRRLQHWIQVGRETVTSNPGPYLFPSRHGGSLSKNQFTSIVRQAGFDAGIQSKIGDITEWHDGQKIEKTAYRVKPHALKHSFVTVLESEGVPRETQSKAANHNNSEITERYRHLDNSDLDILRDIFNIDF